MNATRGVNRGVHPVGGNRPSRPGWRTLCVALAVALLGTPLLVSCDEDTLPSDTSTGVGAQQDSGSVDQPVEEETPEPQTVQEAVDSTYGSFKPVVRNGRGDSVVKLPAAAVGGIVTATHGGSENFTIHVLDKSNSELDLLVNTIGAYKGTTFFSSDDGTPARLKIGADGSWTVRVAPVSAGRRAGKSNVGKGDAVLLYDGGPADWAVTHRGESNFVIKTIGTEGSDLPVNEIGNYTGTIPMGAGPMVVIVQADGSWSAKLR